MPTTYRPYAPDQLLLLPSSLKEWLPEGHLAWFVSDAVDALDLSPFHPRYGGGGPRCQPFDPAMMLKVLVYAYASGVFSSRKIARSLEQDVAFRVLGADNFPAHRTIREFRQVHLSEFSALFVQVVQLAREAGLAKLGRVGIDGTKVKANASKRKAMSYGRMAEREAQLKAQIQAQIQQAEQAEQQDAVEDREHGADRRVTNCRRNWRGGTSACRRSRRPRSAWKNASANRSSRTVATAMTRATRAARGTGCASARSGSPRPRRRTISPTRSCGS